MSLARYAATAVASAAALTAALTVALAGCGAPPAGPAAAAVPTTASTAPSNPVAPPSPVAAPTPVAAPASAAPDPNAPEVVEAGDIPDNQVFVPYSPPDGRYAVSVPEGWPRTDDGAAVVFSDKFNAVRLETVARPGGPPDVASARAEELPAISSAPGFGPGDVTAVTRKGGPAVLITYTATSPVNPVTGKAISTAVERYEFWRAGQEAVLTLSGAKGADNVDPWRIVSDSFRWR